MIAVMNKSGLGELFGTIIINIIGDSKNLYLITAVLCIGSSIATQFMNNMACAGMLAPVGIPSPNDGPRPRQSSQPIAIGAGCSYLTPHRLRDQPDHDDLHEVKIPGFREIRVAAADYFLDSLRGDPSQVFPFF